MKTLLLCVVVCVASFIGGYGAAESVWKPRYEAAIGEHGSLPDSAEVSRGPFSEAP